MNLPATFKEIPVNELEKRLDTTPVPVVVYLYDPDSNLCQLIRPDLEKVAGKLSNRLQFFAVNLTENKNFGYDRRILRTPSFIIFRDGEEIRRWVNVEYSEGFEMDLREFLIGDFLFDTSKFERADSADLQAKLSTNFRLGVICFFSPADPVNWKLEEILRRVRRKHSREMSLYLVNHRDNSRLIQQYGLESTPAIVCIQDENKVKSWDELRNVQEFERQLEELAE